MPILRVSLTQMLMKYQYICESLIWPKVNVDVSIFDKNNIVEA